MSNTLHKILEYFIFKNVTLTVDPNLTLTHITFVLDPMGIGIRDQFGLDFYHSLE